MASSPSKLLANLIATYLANANLSRGSSFLQPQNILAEEASNKVSDLAEFWTPQIVKPREFGLRRLAVAVKTGTPLYYASEHTLAQTERLCPIDVGTGGSESLQSGHSKIEGDEVPILTATANCLKPNSFGLRI